MRTFRQSFTLGIAMMAIAAHVTAAQQTRVLEPDDYYRIQRVGDSKLSPDGRYVLYTVQSTRRETNDRITNIWFTDLQTGRNQRLSTAGVNSTGPNWTPDGKRVYFTTTRGNESGLHFLNFLEPGGEAYRVPGITSAPNYAPDGSWILVARSVAPGENPLTAPEPVAGGRGGGRGGIATADSAARCWPTGTPALTGPSAPTTRGKTEAERNCDVYDIAHATYKRDGTYGFIPPGAGGGGRGGRGGGGGRGGQAGGAGGTQRFTQFFRMPADGLESGVTLTPITTDAVNKSFESFSPDGKWILYTVGGGGGGGRGGAPNPEGEMTAEGQAAQMPEISIFRVASTGGAPIAVTKVRGTVSGVRMSPDAKHVAFVLTERRRGDPILRVVDATSGATVSDIGRGWKYPITAPEWAPTSREVRWVSGIGAQDHVVKALATGGAITPVTSGIHTLTSVSYDRGMRTMAYVKSTADMPGEVFVANADGTNERRISNANAWMQGVRIGKYERITYQGVPHNRQWLDQLKEKGVPYMLKNNAPSGERPEIEAMLLYPPDYQPGRKYPMVTYVHGGPHGRYGAGFNHEFQMVAAQGTLVLYTNPRGSTNYGMDFQYMTLNAWGIDDAKDILQGVDLVVARGLADSTKLAISGGSYGGFMTNWLTAQDQRWKTAITDRSISNWISFYGVSDASSLVEGEFDGMPWPYEHPDSGSYILATMLSPIVWADKVKAPTLIIHSLNDYRVPFAEGEQWYRALQKHNVPVKMVAFPDASHGLSASGEPWLLVRRLREYTNWFRAYLVDDKPVIVQ